MNCSECGDHRGEILLGEKTVCATCFDNMTKDKYEMLIDHAHERMGMLNAGWRETQNGAFYYPDDDNPKIIHLSY